MRGLYLNYGSVEICQAKILDQLANEISLFTKLLGALACTGMLSRRNRAFFPQAVMSHHEDTFSGVKVFISDTQVDYVATRLKHLTCDTKKKQGVFILVDWLHIFTPNFAAFFMRFDISWY
ncbi:uncharacterized protein CYBJADRAFT_166587 [Cyberlindnera jadinii NRRL Y-1542]|uniref:Uncharacterized protein n=1 Tax=Cyberlindnera jadinii (strain ATCC 18201 / CBS 1600 / BCRC 20928 / JCM 3617 / NBRC 0987 / NRRL Y-1542) TaxID=983966 RepID=A0A1E4S5M4_CYBJN|nr:hypothetical protein CYBJADRAFT_166587 [Cyberlindnera jadinii NRRL Y-1542]ODV74804.1 hypothetical protein CYBJADRAFT_166587 [Cyberlindnera jadinii NRRL Y-1542]